MLVLIIISGCKEKEKTQEPQFIDQQPDFCFKIKITERGGQILNLTQCCNGREYLLKGASCWLDNYNFKNKSEVIWEER